MQDEPERRCGFSYKMSLKGGRIGMLGIDHQQGRYGRGEPGADPGVFGGEREVRFAGAQRAEIYAWVERTLVRHEYAGLGRADKGVVRQCIARMTGLSRAQMTRLITGHRKTGQVKAARISARSSPRATRQATWDCWPTWTRFLHSHPAALLFPSKQQFEKDPLLRPPHPVQAHPSMRKRLFEGLL
jgi:hypothetical protein